jgi:excisionase family DNA binding protein
MKRSLIRAKVIKLIDTLAHCSLFLKQFQLAFREVEIMALKSIKQAAETWGVSVYTARRLAAVGLIRTINVGRRRLVPEDEIARISASGVSYETIAQKSRKRKAARG